MINTKKSKKQNKKPLKQNEKSQTINYQQNEKPKTKV